MDWQEQYKHPNWQKRRLDRMELSKFSCERCYTEEEQLHVHHKRYVKGKKIWDYQDDELMVLCESCHQEIHREKDLLNDLIARLPPDGLTELISIAIGYCHSSIGPCNLEVSDLLGENPHAEVLGHIAGVLSIKCIDDLLEIEEKFRVKRNG